MVAAGLVVERRDDVDRRSVRVSLTDAGRAMRPQADVVASAMAEAMGLDPGELVDFVARLRALTGRMGAARGRRPPFSGEDDGRGTPPARRPPGARGELASRGGQGVLAQ